MRKPVSHAIQNPAYRLTGDTFGRPAASRRAPTKLQMDCAKSKFFGRMVYPRLSGDIFIPNFPYVIADCGKSFYLR
jgi:hypothetical protein